MPLTELYSRHSKKKNKTTGGASGLSAELQFKKGEAETTGAKEWGGGAEK